MTVKDKYIACYEHGKPEYFRTIAEIAEHFGIKGVQATELVQSYGKDLVLPDGRKCWLDFLALPQPEKKEPGRPARPLIAFFRDGRSVVFGSMKEAVEFLGVCNRKLGEMVASGEEYETEIRGKESSFFLDELFTGEN